MKNIKFVLLLVLLTFGSCKKVYQCECKLILNGEDWNPKTSNVAIKETKKNAEAECKSMSFDYGWNNYQGCSIK